MANNGLNAELDLKINEYNSALVNLGQALSQAEASGDSSLVSQITNDILAIEQGLNQIQNQRIELSSQQFDPQIDSRQSARESLASGGYKEYEEKPGIMVGVPYGAGQFYTGSVPALKKNKQIKI